jgi:hypothetical protein
MNDGFVETRRDRWGRYLVVPPEGGKPVGYTRATTVAKTLDDTSSLMSWAERMTAIGLARRPDILAQITDAEHDKKALNRLCEQAKEAGGATIRRDLGTALHSILERSWTDPDYTPPAAHIDDVTAVHATIEQAGYRIVEGMNERIVVNDEHRIAGTFDLMLEHHTGRRLIADIKTGSTVAYSGLSFATQLTIYANADNLYTQGAAADGSEDVREPLPELDTSHAIIIHVEPGSGKCTLHRLTLDPTILNLAIAVRTIRKRRDLITELETDVEPEPELTFTDGRDAWIRARIDRIRDADPERLALRWPVDQVPPPKKIDRYDDTQIDLLIPIINDLETICELPFAEPDPAHPAPEPRKRGQPVSPVTPTATIEDWQNATVEMPEEGDLDKARGAELKQRFGNLDPDIRNWIGERVQEANRANLPIRVAEQPTERRCNIAETLIEHRQTGRDDRHLYDTLAYVLDEPTIHAVPLGVAIAVCDNTQSATVLSFVRIGAIFDTAR